VERLRRAKTSFHRTVIVSETLVACDWINDKRPVLATDSPLACALQHLAP